MHPGQVMEVNTASAQDSIWRGLKQRKFRQDIAALHQASNEVPAAPKVHRREEWPILDDDSLSILPFEVEGRLADDFAFLAAAEEGTKAVSAVGLEQCTEHPGMVIRLAANESVPKHVPDAFRSIASMLESCASRKLSRELCTERVFDIVITLNQNRLYGRLQSKHWSPPLYMSNRKREPLHKQLQKLSAQILQQRPKLRKTSRALIQRLNWLYETYESIDFLEKDTSQTFQKLKQIVKQSYDFCTSDSEKTFEETIRGYGFTPSQILTDKRIEQVNKIGRYWISSVHMTEASRKYPTIFGKVDFQIINPYRGIKSPISPNMVFVHAEIQLVTFYELSTTNTLKPRVIGTSKMACYLCDLFLLNHGQFFITKTHGHLYTHWNVPNLAAYSQLQVRQYRRILAMMDEEILNALLRQRQASHNLPHPMTSSANLPNGRQVSPLPSDAGTLISESGSIPSDTPSPAILVEHIDSQTPLVNESVPSPLRLPSPPFEPRITQLSSTSFEQSSSPSIQPRVPSFTGPILDQEPMFRSTTTITPNQLPVQRVISEITPLRLKSGKISAQIELEGTGQGKIDVQSNQELVLDAPGTLVDIGAILPDDSILVERAEADDHLVLRLCYQHESVLISLQWC